MPTFSPFTLTTQQPFGIARWTHSAYSRVLVRWQHAGLEGLGEAAPNAFYGETGGTVMAALEYLRPALRQPGEWRTLLARMNAVLGGNYSAKCAVEMAALDLAARGAGLSVSGLLGLPQESGPESSFTIGLGGPSEMARAAAEAVGRGHSILKIKLGTDTDIPRLEAVRAAAPKATLRVDANAAWMLAQAKAMRPALTAVGVELLEQPLAAGDWAGHRQLRRVCSIPLVADESLHSAASMPALAEAFDGVNIKLSKLGGLCAGLDVLGAARAQHMGVMVGCMIESGLGIAAAQTLAPLCDWVDLDAPLLLAHDPAQATADGLGWGLSFTLSADTAAPESQ